MSRPMGITSFANRLSNLVEASQTLPLVDVVREETLDEPSDWEPAIEDCRGRGEKEVVEATRNVDGGEEGGMEERLEGPFRE